MRVEQLTNALGAELIGVQLADAIEDHGLFNEIRAALLTHRVLFLRDQDLSRAQHVTFARRFGDLEDHPVAGSDPDHPGLVRIYKTPDQPNDRYENCWHSDTTWREAPQFGAVLRCVECVVKPLTYSTFSSVSGWVRTTGCSGSGYCALSARRFSIGMAAPKLASMLWRARRLAMSRFTSSGSRS